MFEMGSAYLPVNDNWNKFIKKSQEAYDLIDEESAALLQKCANQALDKLANDRYFPNSFFKIIFLMHVTDFRYLE